MTTRRLLPLYLLLLLLPAAYGAPAHKEIAAPAAAPAAHAEGWAALEGFRDNTTEQPVFRALELARKSIDIEIYEMSDPDVRAALRSAMARRPEPVRVRVVKDPDPLGENCRYFAPVTEKDSADCRDQKALVAEVRASPGGAFVPFNKAELCGGVSKNGRPKKCFEHGKLMIVDGRYALMSTGNFNSSNLCNQKRGPRVCNRDFSYITSDTDVVKAVSAVFEGDLAGRSYELPALLTPAVSAKLTVSPYSQAPLVAFINSAKKSVRIENQYLKEKAIDAALKARAAAGVKVQVMVSSLCSFGKPKSTRSSEELFSAFERAGIEPRLFTAAMRVGGRPGYLHAKAIVVDDERAWVGSVNGSETATSANREFGVFFDDPSDVRRLTAILESDFSSPASETWRESLECAKDRASGAALD